MQTRILTIADIGDIQITRRRQCRRLSISVNKAKVVRVSIPFRASFTEGERFVFEKIDWIHNAISKISSNDISEIIDENTAFETRSRSLKLEAHHETKFRLRITETQILILYPEHANIKEPKVQGVFRKMMVEALKYEAKEYLPGRVKILAAKHGFLYKDVKVKNAVSRWGSCSYRNNINLNISLIRLPDELSDYIILHELAHTVYKNHGPGFWNLLEKVAGSAKEKALELKKIKLAQLL